MNQIIRNTLYGLTCLASILPIAATAQVAPTFSAIKRPSVQVLEEVSFNMLTQDQGPQNNEWRPISLTSLTHHEGEELYGGLFSPYGLNARLIGSIDHVLALPAGATATVTLRDANGVVVAGPRNCIPIAENMLCTLDFELAHKVGPQPVLYFIEGRHILEFSVPGQNLLLRHVVDFDHP